MGKIYLIPTPISDDRNTDKIPPYLLSVIKGINYFVVENVRTARRWISSLALGISIDQISFYEYHKKSPASQLQEIKKLLKSGETVGVLSEAGCPGIADPGSDLVSWAHRNKVNVVPLIGPSSIFLALMASGFNGQSFVFHGYLPIKENDKIEALRKLEKVAYQYDQTQIFMETPFRNVSMWQSILKVCQAQTRLCLACDVSGKDEYIQSKTIAEWKKTEVDIHKKPCIFLLFSA